MTGKISFLDRLRRTFFGAPPSPPAARPPLPPRQAAPADMAPPVTPAVAVAPAVEPFPEIETVAANPEHPAVAADHADPVAIDRAEPPPSEPEPEPELEPEPEPEPHAEPLPPEITAESCVAAAVAARAAGDDAEAVVILRDATARFPDVAALHHDLAQAAASLPDWTLAEQAWRSFLQLVPGEGAAYAGLAACLRAQDRAEEVEAVLADGIANAPAHPGLAVEYARIADERGDWPLAVERWRSVAEVAPDLPDGPVGQAVALQRLGRVSEAEAVLTELVQHFPEQPTALHDLARLSEHRADWVAAERWWRAYNALHSDYWWSHAALASAISRQGRDEEADAILREGLARFPDQAELVAEYARFAENSNDWDEAIRRWDDVITRYPAAWVGYGGKLRALAQMGRAEEADAALLAYSALLPDDPGALHDLGRRAERHQDWQAAEAAWRGFLRHEQRVDWAFIGLAQALARQDRLGAATQVLADAMRRLPGSAALAIEAARVSEARDRPAEAAAHWRVVARLSPNLPDGAIGEADALTRQGDLAGAEAVIRAAIARLPDMPALATRLAEIEAQRAAQAEGPIDPPPDPEADRIRDLLLAFQSLGGGGGHGGEFAAFQRDYGADPLGLLQWADVLPDELAQALEAEFAGMGEPDQSIIFVPADTAPAEYWITDRHYGMTMPCFIRADELPPEQARHEIEKRIRFLRGKLIDDLRAGGKIFVYLHSKRTVTAPELNRLHAALQRYGAATLLYIRPQDANHRTGTVVWDRPGLLLGSIDHFSHAADTDETLGASSASLLVLCENAHALWREPRGAASGLDRAPMTAGD